MENVKVIIWGLGAMGGGVADMLLSKKGVDIVGVAGREHKQGHSLRLKRATEKMLSSRLRKRSSSRAQLIS